MGTMILLNDFKRQWETVQEPVFQAVRRVGESGWLILGTEVSVFEEALAPWFGKQEAVGMGNCMDATEHALRALGILPGDHVLTTPFSAFATTLAIVRAGGVPVFVDTDDSGQIDLDSVENCLERCYHKIRAVLPVHLYGHPLNLDRLRKIQEHYSIPVIEDCAQAIGAKWMDESVGSCGRISVTSFYPTKNLGAMGDGGAAMTDEPDLAIALRSLRDYGQAAKYSHELLGSNSRLDELQAAILNDAILPRLAEMTARRYEIASAYRHAIQNSEIRVLRPEPDATPVDHLFPVFVPSARRDEFRQYLQSEGIQSAIHYPGLIPDQPAMRACPFVISEDPRRARELAATEVSLPLHPYLRDDEVARVIDFCNAWH
ncbi:MAG: DegT/DnrJ/EryC1/StrS family aminotransferase [Verrucomicrobiae bacterium]|nr:DegT/DnrJ/EryC1/StrS family aminotransferase [Verrucomicrobiae bacterium]